MWTCCKDKGTTLVSPETGDAQSKVPIVGSIDTAPAISSTWKPSTSANQAQSHLQQRSGTRNWCNWKRAKRELARASLQGAVSNPTKVST